MQRQTIAEINLAALRANYRTLCRLAGSAQIIAVVKANAYGHGALGVARCLAAEGARTFAVVTLNEAGELRQAGIAQDILVMGVVDPQRAGEALEQDVIVTVHGLEHGGALERAAAGCAASGGRPKRLRCHLKVDTGMGRLGVPFEEAAALAAGLATSRSLALEGLMSHMSHADAPDPDITEAQLANFRRVIAECGSRGLRPAVIHAANSGTLLRWPQAAFDAARPGLALYGVSPVPEKTQHVTLRPVLTLKSAVALIKEVQPGQGVSYDHAWRAAVPSRIAALPVGYADGYRRVLSNRAVVRIAGQLAPVVGSVCMDTTLIDVTAVPQAQVGSSVVLLEAEADSPLSAWALARAVGTVPHEIFTGLGPRVARVLVERD